jgi:hypothetical protein
VGLLRISNTVGGAVVTNQRKLEPVETRIMLAVAIVLVIVGVLVAIFPRLVAYPIAPVAIWIAGALVYRSYRLRAGRSAEQRAAGERSSRHVRLHQTIAMTMRYSHLAPDHLRAAVAALDGVLPACSPNPPRVQRKDQRKSRSSWWGCLRSPCSFW